MRQRSEQALGVAPAAAAQLEHRLIAFQAQTLEHTPAPALVRQIQRVVRAGVPLEQLHRGLPPLSHPIVRDNIHDQTGARSPCTRDGRRSRRRFTPASAGNSRPQPIEIAIVSRPPATTAGTAPSTNAATPDSNAPS